MKPRGGGHEQRARPRGTIDTDWKCMTVTVGLLLITYRGSRDEQPIRWVRLDDFTNLQRYITNQADMDRDLKHIRQEVKRLRAQGVTDAQFEQAGIDVSRLEPTSATLPLRSYVITTKYGVRYLDPNRTHTLQLGKIVSIRLTQRQRVHD